MNLGWDSIDHFERKYAQSYSRKPALIEYHIFSVGNHRTLQAILVGADYNRARVYIYKLQSIKNDNYKRVQSN